MSEYPKKLVSDAGGAGIVKDAEGEATLRESGYKDPKEAGEKPKAKPKQKPKQKPKP